MTVAELIEQLQKLPQDALVVENAFDHSYRKLHLASAVTADYSHGEYSQYDEDYGEPFGEVITVVVIE